MIELQAFTINPVIAAGLGSGLAALVAFAAFWMRIGRWQSDAKNRSKLLHQRLDDAFRQIDKQDDSIGDAHIRLDTHFQGHP